MLSDSDTSDSDDGVRFKTATTRSKEFQVKSEREKETSGTRSREAHSSRSRRSPDNSSRRHSHKKKSHRRSESRSRDRDYRKRHKSPIKIIEKQETKIAKVNASTTKCDTIVDTYGPTLPSRKVLPPVDLQSIDKNASSEENVKSADIVCGPALPPHLLKRKSSNAEEDSICGPTLPPSLLKQKETLPDEDTIISSDISSGDATNTKPSTAKNSSERSIGPFIPEHLRKQLSEQTPDERAPKEEDDVDDCFGPLPPELASTSNAHIALEERALQIKLDQLAPKTSDAKMREEWMIELPTVQASNLGLGPRQFRAKAGPDMSDRSSWTDTPGTTKKTIVKQDDLKHTAELNEIRKRDEEQEAMVAKAKKKHKRDKSLLEKHQEKMNAKKKEDKEQGIRRPFNREIDLKVNRFDDAQKKSILKKAQLLDDRFSQGQSKFL